MILGFTAGVLIGLIAFDLVPEIFAEIQAQQIEPTGPMLALVFGFLLFHIVEKLLVIHSAHEEQYAHHHHPQVGIASALALSGHSFMDGVGIGLGFQAGTAVGIAVAVAVIAHDFADGLNTMSLMLVNKNTSRRAIFFLVLDAAAPVLGAASTLLFRLPEAHSEGSAAITVLLTVLGASFVFLVTRFL
jgi:ZIP family zinc transporter